MTPKGGWTQEVDPYGYIFSNDQGSVFFPALGRNNTEVNSYGNYWVLGGKRFSVNGSDAYFGDESASSTLSVRLVRGL